MRIVGWILSLVAAFLLSNNNALLAQQRTTSQFGTQGTVGQVGTNLTGSIVGQSTTLGSTLGGTSGQPFGTVQSGTQLGNTQTGTSTSGFVGRSDNAGRFVGDQRVSQQTGATAGQRQFGAAGTGRNNAARFGNQGGARGQGRTVQRVIRPRQEIAFQFPGRDIAALKGQVTGRFSRLGRRDASLPGVSIEITSAGKAVLTGEVVSEDSRKLAEIMVRLEPGVHDVVNELTVAAAQ